MEAEQFLSTHQFLDTWVFSPLLVIMSKVARTFAYRFCVDTMSSFLCVKPRSEIARSKTLLSSFPSDFYYFAVYPH